MTEFLVDPNITASVLRPAPKAASLFSLPLMPALVLHMLVPFIRISKKISSCPQA